jgi:PleD family two-component response regulator
VSPISFFSVSEALRLLEEKSKIVLDTPVSREAIRRALKKTNFDLTKTTTGASPPKKKMMPNL